MPSFWDFVSKHILVVVRIFIVIKSRMIGLCCEAIFHLKLARWNHRYRRYRSPTGPERRDIFKIQDGGASGQKAQVTWENNTNMGIFQHGLCKIYTGFSHDFGFI